MDISSSSSSWLDYPNHVKNIYAPTEGGGSEEEEEEEDIMWGSASSASEMRREHMFDKVVTPSDVGKLNRLVIPKQHAEKYFPLDASTSDKGLHLNFEDRSGKPWRFRYSYWNSSQSYVMTKGWSRFVKDKRLDAGDIVSFFRGVGHSHKDRLYIDWRRRPTPLSIAAPTAPPSFLSAHQFARPFFFRPPLPLPWDHYHQHHHLHQAGQVLLGHCTHHTRNTTFGDLTATPNYYSHHREKQQIGIRQEEEDKKGKKTTKRLRLFGVNMDCNVPEHESSNPISSTSNSSSSKPPSPPSFEFQILN